MAKAIKRSVVPGLCPSRIPTVSVIGRVVVTLVEVEKQSMASAAAAIARARRDIQHEFFSQDAVRAERAIAFDPSRHVQRVVFERWRRAGVIHEARPGYYWLDVIAYDVDLRQRHFRMKIALLVVVLFLLMVEVVTLLSLRHS